MISSTATRPNTSANGSYRARVLHFLAVVYLIGVGLMLVTGAWTEMMQWLRSWIAAMGLGESFL